jgi:hypothetical protein
MDHGLKTIHNSPCNPFATRWVMRIESQNSVVMLRLSAKQKREVYSISSLLLHLIVFIALLLSLNSCGLLNQEEAVEPETCNTFATIKDTRGLDGCGFVLVLDNGRKLEPVMVYNLECGWGIQQPGAFLGEVALVDGKRVMIGYKESTRPSICMVGQTVEITCISEVNPAPASTN